MKKVPSCIKESWDQMNWAGKFFLIWFGVLCLTVTIYTPLFFSPFKAAYPQFTSTAGICIALWFWVGILHAVGSLIYTMVTGRSGPWDKPRSI